MMLAWNGAGNVFVADGGNSLIRMITPGGLVSTFAGGGAGTGGSTNGIGIAATFGDPTGVTVDKFGNVYVADGLTNLIRKITPAGLVSTIAGSGAQGSANGIGVAASFYAPIGIAVDSKENLYVADDGNNLIRKIILTGYTIDKALPPGLTFDPATGIISGTPTANSPATDYTVTGYNSTGSSSAVVNIAIGSVVTLTPPPNIAYQTPQTYYVNTTITPLTPTNTGGAVPPNIYGDVTAFAGTGSAGNANGAVAAASFNGPASVVFDNADNLFVSESTNNDIREITPAGVVSTFAGTGTNNNTNGPGNAAGFNSPYQITFDAAGNMYVADEGNMIIRKITPAAIVSTFAGTGMQSSTDGTTSTATFDTPFGVAVDAAGDVYVADRGSGAVRKIDVTGQVTTYNVFDGSATLTNNGGLAYLAVDASGNLYLVDNNQVKMITPSGGVTIIAGSTTAGSANGTGAAAAFNKLMGIAVDAAGDIYVGDAYNNSIRRITPAGVVTTLAGNGGHGFVNGVSSTASFNTPYGVTIDNTGNFLYVADWGNNLIRKVAITGYSIDKSLPTGMTFDPTTGIISGTPAVLSPLTTYTVTAYNTGGSSATTVNIEVDEQTVTFPPIPAKTVCDADFDPGATSAGAITYTSANTAVATIVAGELHITGPGTSVITASDGTSQPTQTLTVTAAVTPTIIVSPAAIDTCQGSAVIYSAVITNGGTNPVYQWQLNGQNTGSNSPTFTSSNLSNNDQIACTLTSNAVCTTNVTATSNLAAFTVDQPAPPTISIISTATGAVCPGTELDFIATAVSPGNDLSYQWQVNGLNVGGNSATFSSSSLANGDLVTCTLSSAGKCLIDPSALSNTITVSLNPASACIIVIPNAFTPNGDGVNDIWDIQALQGYPQCTVNIFNRYGAMVYSSIGYPKAWDGTYGGSALPVGTYYYIIDLKNGRKKLAGPVTILR